MKKAFSITSLILVCVMMFALASCQSNGSDNGASTGTSTATSSGTSTATSTATDTTPDEPATLPDGDASTVNPDDASTVPPVADPELEKLMADVYKDIADMPAVMNTVVDATNSEYFLGVADLSFDAALASDAMINAIAHSVVLVRVKDGADIDDIKAQIKENIDPRKWVCVGVEKVTVESSGNIIIAILDDFAPDKLLANFQAAAPNYAK